MGGAGIGQRRNLAQSYFNRFPPVFISRELSEEAGRNRLQLSYARRLNRPNFMPPPPLAIYRDPRSYRLGTPRLRAEYNLSQPRWPSGGALMPAPRSTAPRLPATASASSAGAG